MFFSPFSQSFWVFWILDDFVGKMTFSLLWKSGGIRVRGMCLGDWDGSVSEVGERLRGWEWEGMGTIRGGLGRGSGGGSWGIVMFESGPWVVWGGDWGGCGAEFSNDRLGIVSGVIFEECSIGVEWN